ncbi:MULTISPECIES: transcriptional regulator BetI [Paraburkholderia]|uniref:transcriptional regulator BetI n=1 Tax=Paraburkholderia TaxID=1822464 RepID=UPI001CACD6B9|nr:MULTISPECIES: transcriptional regulator BetI [Paraburkholderia]GJH01845.1 transcriptional regulator BetI [Paraburkholderia terrae]CAG9271606.1 DNA-binding transcriptional repressor BetI [Paraburkholderia caribensis]
MPKVGMREVRRAQLIDATLLTIDQSGLSGTTLASVAQRANISTGIVSHYFGDKDGLLEATMRHILRDLWAATTRRRIAAKPQARARLRAIVAANFDVSQVSGPVMKTWLAFWSESMHEPALRRLQRVNTRRLYSNLCAEFARELPRTAARRAASGLAAMIDGLWLRGALSGDPFDTKAALRLANDYIDLLLAQSGS